MSKRKCRKCDEIIPNWVKIEGKARCLRNRKFCLSCSPFRGNNTRKDDPSKESPYKRGLKWSERSEEYKQVHRARVYRKGLLRKDDLINRSGGGCKVCGYSKCFRALHFHHRDPDTKKFQLTLNNLWSKSWDSILEEFEKCDLLCSNCHLEIEDENSQHGEYRRIIKEKWGDSFL